MAAMKETHGIAHSLGTSQGTESPGYHPRGPVRLTGYPCLSPTEDSAGPFLAGAGRGRWR